MDELRPLRQALLALPKKLEVAPEVKPEVKPALVPTEEDWKSVEAPIKVDPVDDQIETPVVSSSASTTVKEESVPHVTPSSLDEATAPAQTVLQLSATHRKKRPAPTSLPTRRSKRQTPHLTTDSQALKQEF